MSFSWLHPGFAARLALAVIAACALSTPAWVQSSHGSPASQPELRQPVLVELFTSEGCSDCPPADALLARLDATQFVPGAQAIVLSEHVTYWDHQGWRDPFSLDAVTARQQQYSQDFGLSDLYTPQMVVDGAEQFVGSDSTALIRAVTLAAARPMLPISIQNARWTGDTVRFSVRAPASSNAKLIAVLAENETHSEVSAGENAGRTLHHVAVVRVLREYGSNVADGRALSLSTAGLLSADKSAGPLRLVVFLADRSKDHVEAVAEQTLAQ